MSVRYDRNATFMGVPMTKFRDLLRAWENSRSVSGSASPQRIGLDPITASVLIDEAEVQGLFGIVEQSKGHETYGPTEAGLALIGATPMQPIERAKAKPLIDGIIANAENINARDDLFFRVTKIWVYGSYVKGAPAVNDVDLVVETERTERWTNKFPEVRKFIKMACDMGGESFVYARICPNINAMTYILNKLVFGARRHPRISTNGLGELVDMGCECQLVFDAARGGAVDDPVLARHPDSEGRRPDFGDPRVMPKLDPQGSLRPTSPRLIDLDDRRLNRLNPERDWRGPGEMVKSVHFAGSLPEGQKGFKKVRDWMRSVTDADGRNRCMIAVGNVDDRWRPSKFTAPPVGLVIDRRIEITNSGYKYSLDIALTNGSKLGKDTIQSAACHVLSIAACDLEKIARHMAEGESVHRVAVMLSDTAETALSESVIEQVGAALLDPAMRCLTGFASDMFAEVEIDVEFDQKVGCAMSM